jgi:hypothetical protein
MRANIDGSKEPQQATAKKDTNHRLQYTTTTEINVDNNNKDQRRRQITRVLLNDKSKHQGQ